LRVAEARLRQARAVRERSAADFWPTLDVGFLMPDKTEPEPAAHGALPLPANFPFEYSVYQAGFDASWEIDLFGGKRRALEAATAEWEGAIEARNDAMVSLLAEVARNYVELRGGQHRLEIARQGPQTSGGSFGTHPRPLSKRGRERTRRHAVGGLACEPCRRRFRRSKPPCGAMYGIAVLLGQEPGELVAELSPPMPVPPAPPEVPIGLPSDLLRRRPDVRQAERQLAAETARIGVAKSDWFPKLSLTGDVGSGKRQPWQMVRARQPFLVARPEPAMAGARFRPGARGSAGPNRRAGGGAGDVRENRADFAARGGERRRAYAQEQNRHGALADEVAENRRSLDMANGLYAEGRVNFLDVLDAGARSTNPMTNWR
jgi:outer membrane protein, multidrug efflux system